METILKVLLILLLGSNVLAQATFQKTYGGAGDNIGYSVQQTTDGGYVIVGITTSSFGSWLKDIYFIKTDVDGDTLFTKTYGLLTGYSNEVGVFVQQTLDGGYIIIGNTDENPSHDAFLIKTDSHGLVVWSKTFGGYQGGQSKGVFVQQTNDGGYVFTGYTAFAAFTGSGISLVKTDANGTVTWKNIFDGGYNEEGHSIKQTIDGGYIITGETYSFGAGGADAVLIKTNNSGTLLWSKTYGGTNDDIGNSVTQTSDGGYIIAGTSSSFGVGLTDVLLIKTDSIGDTIFTKCFGGFGDDSGFSVQETNDKGYIILGSTNSFGSGNSDVYFIKTDSLGKLLWSKTYGRADDQKGYSVQQTTDGGYIFTGSSGTINPQIYLIKTDNTGNSGCNETNSATVSTVSLAYVDSTILVAKVYPGTTSSVIPLIGEGGVITTFCFTAINELENSDGNINIYPNPAQSKITIEFEAAETKNASIEIKNILGQTVKTVANTAFSKGANNIDIREFLNGLYFVQLQSGNKIINKKFIKQ